MSKTTFQHLKKWNGGETGIDSLSNYIGETRFDWYVCCGRNRDSDVLTNCNFDVALEELGGEQDGKVEIFETGHWACGWVQVILIHESATDLLAIGEDIGERLHQYPVLDDDAFSEAEDKDREEWWTNGARSDLERTLAKHFESLGAPDGDQYLDAVRETIDKVQPEWPAFEILTNTAYHHACQNAGESTCLDVEALEHELGHELRSEPGARDLLRLLGEYEPDLEALAYRIACRAYDEKHQLKFGFYEGGRRK